MTRKLRLLAVVLPLLLAACAPAVRTKGDAAQLDAQRVREQQLANANHWTLQGRLSISGGDSPGGTGSLVWKQDGDRYTFEIRGPAISGANFRLTGGPEGALLEGLRDGPLRGPDAEALMRKAVGWEVPLRDLRAWVLGLRADSGAAELDFGVDRLPALLQQDGWTVDYREWDTVHQPPLPKKVFAQKLPYKVRLSIESWQFQ
jgi:outer membrane lipoprotein LolB